MNLIVPSLIQFFHDLGLPISIKDTQYLWQLDLEQSGTLQVECHQGQLSLWLSCQVPGYQSDKVIRRAMTFTASCQAPVLPVRCGWLDEEQLILFVTMDERSITLPLLHQALDTLIRLQRKALAP